MVALPNEIVVKEIRTPVPPDLLSTRGKGSGRVRVFEFGVMAASLGQTKDDCPYESGQGSGSFRKAWLRGFDAYTAARERKAAS